MKNQSTFKGSQVQLDVQQDESSVPDRAVGSSKGSTEPTQPQSSGLKMALTWFAIPMVLLILSAWLGKRL